MTHPKSMRGKTVLLTTALGLALLASLPALAQVGVSISLGEPVYGPPPPPPPEYVAPAYAPPPVVYGPEYVPDYYDYHHRPHRPPPHPVAHGRGPGPGRHR